MPRLSAILLTFRFNTSGKYQLSTERHPDGRKKSSLTVMVAAFLTEGRRKVAAVASDWGPGFYAPIGTAATGPDIAEVISSMHVMSPSTVTVRMWAAGGALWKASMSSTSLVSRGEPVGGNVIICRYYDIAMVFCFT